jgi:hypothetical protein
LTNQCHCHGAKKKGVEITIFSWSSILALAHPLSYDLIKRQGCKEYWVLKVYKDQKADKEQI